MKKRAQVSVFILLGIIVIAVIGAVAYFYGDQIQNFTRPGTLDASRLEPLKSFVTLCMEESVNEDLINLKKNSGYFNKISSTVIYSGYEINAIVDKSSDVPNKMNSKTGIENEISANVKDVVMNDCDLSDFEIVKGEIKVETDIKDSSVVVKMDYPLVVSKGETSLTVNDFNVIIEDDFGKIYDAENGIIYRIVTDNEEDGFVFGVKNE